MACYFPWNANVCTMASDVCHGQLSGRTAASTAAAAVLGIGHAVQELLRIVEIQMVGTILTIEWLIFMLVIWLMIN